MRRRKMKKQKRIIIVSSLCLLLCLCVGYAAFNTQLSIRAKGNIKDKSKIMQSWDLYSTSDFHSDYYRQNIVSITFVNYNTVPENAAESWNVSEDKTHGGVMAWVVSDTNNTAQYDLFIGAEGGVVANESCDAMFYNFPALSEINFNGYFDTSSVTSMENMFSGSNNLLTIDLSGLDTSNVVSMYSMFSRWDTPAGGWGTNNLSEIIFGENFNTSSVTNMSDMFSGFKGTELDLSMFDTSSVTNMYHMFNNCENIETLNLCSFDTSAVTSMKEMFAYTTNIEHIYVNSNWKSSGVDMSNMFYNSGVSSVEMNNDICV